ncbi:unnamed protein product [Polarella glacialis]|uniref:Uncharacterized protein n=1 Tax=Polarella glacialis TaxID=89957 RepID=A0A813K3R2_POLGL|nr:unnamed protein product [Polarella glacialis]
MQGRASLPARTWRVQACFWPTRSSSSRPVRCALDADMVWRQAFGQHMDFSGQKIGLDGALALARRFPQTGMQCISMALDFCDIGAAGVHAIAQRLSKVKFMTLQFENCALFTDAEAVALTMHFAVDLQSLRLGLKGCGMTTAGARAIAKKLPSNMFLLSLLLNSSNIGTRGFYALAQSLPPELFILELNPGMDVDDAGLRMFADNLSANLVGLTFNLDDCSAISDASLQHLFSCLPTKATQITLGICCEEEAEQLSNQALIVLADRLRACKKLRFLDLCVSQGAFDDDGVESLSFSLKRLKNLKILKIMFMSCGEISNAAALDLAENLPEKLMELKLSFFRCTFFDEHDPVDLLPIITSLPQQLLSLTLNFGHCCLIVAPDGMPQLCPGLLLYQCCY